MSFDNNDIIQIWDSHSSNSSFPIHNLTSKFECCACTRIISFIRFEPSQKQSLKSIASILLFACSKYHHISPGWSEWMLCWTPNFRYVTFGPSWSDLSHWGWQWRPAWRNSHVRFGVSALLADNWLWKICRYWDLEKPLMNVVTWDILTRILTLQHMPNSILICERKSNLFLWLQLQVNQYLKLHTNVTYIMYSQFLSIHYLQCHAFPIPYR